MKYPIFFVILQAFPLRKAQKLKSNCCMRDIYPYLMLFASGVILTLSVIVLAVRIPDKPEFKKFRKARKIFAIACATLAFLNLLCFIVGYSHPYDKLAILATGPFQALLLTSLILVFINPEVITFRCVMRDVLVITAVISMPYLSYWLWPAAYEYIYRAAAGLFLVQLFGYAGSFAKSFRKIIKLTNEYYAENNAPRLSWIHWMFLSALATGICAFVCLCTETWSYLALVPMYVLTYLFFTIKIINYAADSGYIVMAINSGAEVSSESEDAREEEIRDERIYPEIPENIRAEIRENIDKWVSARGFTEKDVPYTETLEKIGVDVVMMRRYMKDELGTDFRTWRNSLRLEEACRLFSEAPEMTVEQVSDNVGYNDSSNFRKDFKKRYEMAPSEYRKTVFKNKIVSQNDALSERP